VPQDPPSFRRLGDNTLVPHTPQSLVSAWLAGRDGCAAMSVDYAALTDFARPFSVPLLDAAVNVFYTSSNTEEVRAAPRRLAARRCSVLATRWPRAGSARAVTRFEEGLHLPPRTAGARFSRSRARSSRYARSARRRSGR
jgi:hypothetical protein